MTDDGAVPAGPDQRQAALDAMPDQELDVIVIGGGVVGAGAALDAATCGLTVGLFEARDWAAGTSSRSSKLIHGGLRDLEMLDFRLVREALRERGLLTQRLAPHLVRPVPFLDPLKHCAWERLDAGLGLLLYDTMGISSGNARGLPKHRHLTSSSAAPARRFARTPGRRYRVLRRPGRRCPAHPCCRPDRGPYGALGASWAPVIGFLREGERVTGVRVRDLESGRDLEVRAEQVVNATGVWTDDTQRMAGEHGQFYVRASKGIHLVVPRDRIPSATGLILRTESRALRDPLGPELDHRHHGHRLGPGQGASRRVAVGHRLSARARQPGSRHAVDPRRRPGRLRRVAPAPVRRVRAHVEAVPEHMVAHPYRASWS